MAKLGDQELRAVLDAEIQASVLWAGEAIGGEQLKNFSYYLGLPLGNELPGRSQIVSWDVFEVIESAMPGFLEPFFSGDQIGEFSPREPGDERFCDQATDYVNYLIKDRNEGFGLISTWAKDGLLSKVGVVRVEWEEADPKKRAYRGLTDEQLAMIAQDERIQLTAHSEYPQPGLPPEAMAQLQAAGQQPPMLHDVEYTEQVAGCVKVVNVRPENFIISKGITHHSEARVIGEWVTYTRGELKAMGIRQHIDVQSFDKANALLSDALSLLRDDQSTIVGTEQDNGDPAMEEVRLFKGYLRADVDGDGIAEWRRVLVGSGESPFLENEEAEDHNYALWSPIMIPHRVIGMALADPARNVQELKSALTRQYLDSLYLANRPRLYVNTDAQVSLDDVLSERIGGVIRGRGDPRLALQPIQTANVSRDALEGLQLADGMREMRTGVPKMNPGLEADALHQSATGVRSINNSVAKRQKMMLRTFAESGVKRLFKLVLAMVCKYQDVPAMVRMRGEFVSFDPRQWNPDMDAVIDIGMGNSDETETLMMLNQMGAFLLGPAAQMGVVRPENVYEFGVLMAKNARIKGAENKLLTDPRKNPAPQQPNPELMKAQAQAQADVQKYQAQVQFEREKMGMQAEVDRNRQQVEAEQKAAQAQQQMQVERYKAELDAQAEQQRLDFERWKAQHDAELQMTLKRMELMHSGAMETQRMEREEAAGGMND